MFLPDIQHAMPDKLLSDSLHGLHPFVICNTMVVVIFKMFSNGKMFGFACSSRR